MKVLVSIVLMVFLTGCSQVPLKNPDRSRISMFFEGAATGLPKDGVILNGAGIPTGERIYLRR